MSTASVDQNLPTFIVGIGASAGGLEALEMLFQQMPMKTGMAYVVIQHLSPDFKSMMDELLARKTHIPIVVAEDGMEIVKDHIFLLPPKKEMIVSDYKLLLTDRESDNSLSLPINTFFRSLADSHQHKGIAVVLSGTGSDGTRGATALHDAGGFVIAQTPETCRFDAMPSNVIASKKVDLIVEPENIPDALVRYSKRTKKIQSQIELGDLDSEENRFSEIILVVNNRFGIDFSQYKPSTIVRRLERRLTINKVEGLEEYLNLILSSPEELESLYFDLLIGVTQFFRDDQCFADLSVALPDLLNHLGEQQEVRVWVAGCATGQEAYSIAILLAEAIANQGLDLRFKVFATDIHRNSITKAGNGIYSQTEVDSVGTERLERFFQRVGEKYQVKPEIRKAIVFAQHNILKDPPFTKTHLVCCRNLLIYFNQKAQSRVLNLLSFSLQHQGLLFLGPSESVGGMEGDFKTVSQSSKLFKKARDIRIRPELPTQMLRGRTEVQERSLSDRLSPSVKSKKALETLLQIYVPPSVLIDTEGNILHIFGNAREYLTHDSGSPSLNIKSMVGDPAKLTLIHLLTHVSKSMKPAKSSQVKGFHGRGLVDIEIRPLSQGAANVDYLIVSFLDSQMTSETRESADTVPSASATAALSNEYEELKEELQFTKESLQTTVEELETSNEELQASNEELMASNEELQSTNEELQSVNEELYTVNAEYQAKERERAQLEGDEKTLLSLSDVGVLFLDQNLKVRKFSPKAARFFGLLETDVERPFAAVNVPTATNIKQIVADVSYHDREVEAEIESHDGHYYQFRFVPYDAALAGKEPGRPQLDDEISRGVIITFTNISHLKELQEGLSKSEKRLRDALAQVSEGYFEWNIATDHYFFSRDWLERWGFATSEDSSWDKVLDDQDYRDLRQAMGELHNERSVKFALPIRVQHGGNTAWMFCRGTRVDSKAAGILVDVNKLKTSETTLAKENKDLRRSNELLEGMAYVASHDLKAPLRHIRLYSEFLRQALENNDTGEVHKQLGAIENSTGGLSQLIDDLITYSRISSVTKKAFKLVDLNDTLGEVLRVFDGEIEAKKAQTNLQRLPTVEGEASLLFHLFQNLVDNSLKYVVEKPLHLKITAEKFENCLIVSFADNGPGINEDFLTKVFEPFRRLVGSAEISGSGIGLAICKNVMELHEGSIEVVNLSEGGCEFRMRFPLVAGAKDE